MRPGARQLPQTRDYQGIGLCSAFSDARCTRNGENPLKIAKQAILTEFEA